jgi:two-component system, cell cycle sensor histidine kinase and response regulator CckA
MKPARDWNQMRERIIGLGEESSRKSFYPELQQQVARLEQTQENLRTLFNAIPDAIFITDLEGRLLEVNDATLTMFGVTRENFQDFPSADYCHQAADEATIQKGRQVTLRQLQLERHLLQEWTARKPVDGHTFEVEGALRIAHWGDQEVIISVVRDITERKHLEAMLHQSQKLDALGQLAGGMAHDTNNMLGVIIGYTELLEEKVQEDPLAKQDLAQIRKAALRSSDLIRQLLAFARKQTIQPRRADLNHVVEDTQRMLRRLIGENLGLVWKPATVLWSTWVDPSQIDQILANLTVNARDSIDGSGSITLETDNLAVDQNYCQIHPDATPGDYVMLSVTDTGQGMTPEVQARIFEPFFTTKEAGRGTGLGLAMVYGIVRQNGGFITVYSAPGMGTTFRLHFPRYRAADASEEAAFEEEALPGGQETILLVEDEEELLVLQKTILELAGYHVLPASRSLEAQLLAQREGNTLDLLVTDLVMPDMNGWELHQWISLLAPGIKTLFMSGYPAGTLNPQEAIRTDRDFLQKPFSRADLLRKVRQLLDRGI